MWNNLSNEIDLGKTEESEISVISRLLSIETSSYLLMFFGMLGILTILAIAKQPRFVIILGVGTFLAFLLIMFLSLSDRLYDLFCEKQRGTSIGLALLVIFIILVWALVPEDNTRLTLLVLVVSGIFLIWTLAQAYFMSIPITNISAQAASKFEVDPKSTTYSYLVLGASLVVSILFYHYLSWKLLPTSFLGIDSNGLKLVWVIGMMVLVGTLWVLILRFLRPIMDKQDAIIFGGVFFTIYMLFIFYRSMFFLAKLNELSGGTGSSNVVGRIIDVIFMIVTILLAVYSFSKKAFRTNLPVINENNSVFIAYAFGTAYASAQLYLIASAADTKEMITWISLLSHLLIFICAIIILLFIPYSYVIAKGYAVPKSFRSAFSLRNQGITTKEPSVKGVPAKDFDDKVVDIESEIDESPTVEDQSDSDQTEGE